MNQSRYLARNFYFISDRLQYTIRGEVQLEEEIDGAILQQAVDTAFRRYPYFSVQLAVQEEEYVLIPNPRPHTVVQGKAPVVLGSEDVGYHLAVISYYENKIIFNFAHSITDGAGRAPLTKTVLYYYLTEKYHITLDAEGIYLADEPLYADEDSDPIPDEDVAHASASGFRTIGEAYKLSEGGHITDREKTEYRFRIREDAFMETCKARNATPNTLTATLLAQSAAQLDPAMQKNVVVNLCINMRPGLKNRHSHLFLLSCIPLSFSAEQLKQEEDADAPVMRAQTEADPHRQEQLCHIAREQIRSQTGEENIRFLHKKNLMESERIAKIKKLSLKKKIIQGAIYGKEGFLSATFIASYVGRNNLGSLSPYVKAMYTTVDSAPENGAIIEITTADGWFFFTYTQDFSTDIYVNELIRQFEALGMRVERTGKCPLHTPRIQLPER